MKLLNFWKGKGPKLVLEVALVFILLASTVGVVSADSPKDTLFTAGDCPQPPPGWSHTGKSYAWDGYLGTVMGHELTCYYENPKTGGKARCEFRLYEQSEEGVKDRFTKGKQGLGPKDLCSSITPGWLSATGDTLVNNDDRWVVLCRLPERKPNDEFHEIVGKIRYGKCLITIRVESYGNADIVTSAFNALEKSSKALLDKKGAVDGEEGDCNKFCSQVGGHRVWDKVSEWPECKCICEPGYGLDGQECVECKAFCAGKGDHWIYDPRKSEPGYCDCSCEVGYKTDAWEECKKVECPGNSTNIADLGGSCPKDREKLNDYCCCDPGYVPWGGVCIKEEDVPGTGKVVCGKWGCQEGENCLNCPEDCGCIPPEICDPWSPYSDYDNEEWCSPPVAYIIVSRSATYGIKQTGLAAVQQWFTLPYQNHIREYYRSLGYKVKFVEVYDEWQVLNVTARPSTKAIAYFGHGVPEVPPVMEGRNATLLRRGIDWTLSRDLNRLGTNATGMNATDRARFAQARANNLNLDYAYIYTCFSLGGKPLRWGIGRDTSLADYLLRPGGTYWGEEGFKFAGSWQEKHVKP